MSAQNLGAHVSAAGGLHKAIQRVAKLGGSCLQLFAFSPRNWHKRSLTEDEIQHFLSKKKDSAVKPIFFHAVYLINLADDSEVGRKSVEHLTHELQLAHKLGIEGSVVHLGSYKQRKNKSSRTKRIRQTSDLVASVPSFPPLEKYDLLLKNIREVLSKTPTQTSFIIENAGTRKIGQTIKEIARIVQDLNNPRVKVCLDTCHLHAAGYDLSGKEGFNLFLEGFDKQIGLGKLAVWHLNDSRDRLGSLRDRHENIGEGEVGVQVFRNILTHSEMRNLPMIIETPGFNGQGPDAKNLKILRAIRDKASQSL